MERFDFIISCKYASVPGEGTLTRLFYLAKFLVEAGYKVKLINSFSNHLSLITKSEVESNRLIDGVYVETKKTLSYGNSSSIFRLFSWVHYELQVLYTMLFRNRSRIFIVSSPSILSTVTGLIVRKLTRSQLITDIRDIWPATLVEEGNKSLDNPFIKLMAWIEKLGYSKSDMILSSIPKLNKHIKETIGIARPFHCFPMGYDDIDLKDLESQGTEVACPFKTKPNNILVGYAGSLGMTNNMDGFIDVIAESNDEQIDFLIVGDGVLLEVYKNKLSSNNNVTFTGRVTKQTARNYLKACDVVYLSTHESSLWRYGQSMNKLFDYMLLGKTVLASYPKDGYQSMINEANCGRFIASNSKQELIEALRDFMNMDRKQLNSIGSAGQTWILHNRHYRSLTEDFLKALEHYNLLNDET